MGEARPARSRSGSFGRLVLLGVVSAGVLALASNKTWVDYRASVGGRPLPREPGATDIGTLPLAGALGLLLLATWGVLLVTRGRVRRVLGVLAVVISAGLVACVVAGWLSLPDDVRASVGAQGAGDVSTQHTAWFWTAVVAAVVSLVVTVLSVVAMPRWPEMGRRYDAPATAGPVAAPAADDPEADNLTLWKAIEQGQDPTDAGPGRDT